MSAQQNLVPNGSFEDTVNCPSNYDELNKTMFWYKPTQGTPDLFNSCNTIPYFIGTPSNGGGYQFPKDGRAYAGFAVNFDTSNGALLNYREYLQIKLISKLDAGKKYTVSFFVSRADSFFIALKDIGAFISKFPIGCNCSSTLILSPQVVYGNFVTDNNNWTEVKGEFLANGTEEFLTLGYFKNNNSTDTVFLKPTNDLTAYYYLDKVSIFQSPDLLVLANVFTPNNDGINDTFRSPNDAVEICIYNRWGIKIFGSKEKFDWNGNSDANEPCSAGVYYYIIQTETETYKGFLELIK
jgi:gliding motility-associated-like protein